MSSSGGHVLVVDDNPALIRILRKILEVNGFACEDAENEDRALEKVNEETRAVIADIDLSETGGSARGGIVLAERLRKLAPRPLILISQTPWHHFAGERLSGSDGWMAEHNVRTVLDRTEEDFSHLILAHLDSIFGSVA